MKCTIDEIRLIVVSIAMECGIAKINLFEPYAKQEIRG